MAESHNEAAAPVPVTATDWEAVFEQSELGLIPLIAGARSPGALEKIIAVIAESLLVRKDDPPEIQALKEELTDLVPEGATADELPGIVEEIAPILRQIKDQRIKRAAEHEAQVAEARNRERRADRRKGRENSAGRGTKRSGPGLLARRARKRARRKARLGSAAFLVLTLVALAAAGATVFFAVVGESSKAPDERTLQFIDEMTAVAGGEKRESHVFGGPLSTGVLGGKDYVLAELVPPDTCAGAGWVLGNRGTVVINSILPPSLSPQMLQELCERMPQGATFTWFPEKTDEAGRERR